MVRAVKALGLETCATLGMLSDGQAEQLKEAGLDYYNHNLDTAPEFYGEIITTREYQDRLDTLERVRHAGIKVCCGGIVGMGESRAAARRPDRAAGEPRPAARIGADQPPGAGRGHAARTAPKRSIRWNSCAPSRSRASAMPKSFVRLSAGRREMSDAVQALCFLAGANSIFYGDKLLTTGNPEWERDRACSIRWA